MNASVASWCRAQAIVLLAGLALAGAEPARITVPRPLQDVIPLAAQGQPVAAIVTGSEEAEPARILQAEVQRLTGVRLPIVADGAATAATAPRNLIALGNLVTNPLIAQLYLNDYTFEDRYFPGDAGYVIRPLINPLGDGRHIVVVGGSSPAGVAAGVQRLVALLQPTAQPGALGLKPVLEVQPGTNFRGWRTFPWTGPAGRDHLQLASKYLRTGEPQLARAYHDFLLTKTMQGDALPVEHLWVYLTTRSWEAMEACGGFTPEERLKVANAILALLRGSEGYGYLEPYTRPEIVGVLGNHVTRAALGFYFGYRHFAKYYADQVPADELARWQDVLTRIWRRQFQAYRNLDEAYSQHGYGGSHENTLTMAFCLPDLAKDFFDQGVARRLADYLMVQCNNLGWCPRGGDAGGGDYPLTPLLKIAYRYGDGRYLYMPSQRGDLWTSTDEPFRGFATDLKPVPPTEQLGVFAIAPLDPLYLAWAKEFRGDTAKTFDKLAFRDGFGPDDAYLLLDGVGGGSHAYQDQNTIPEFSQNARLWLCQPDLFVRPSLGEHNALTYTRDGLGPTTRPLYPELVAVSATEHFAYSQTALRQYGDGDWVRHVFHPRGGEFLVLDELRAHRGGDFALTLHWRSIGDARLSPGRFESLQDEQRQAAWRLGPRELKQHVRSTSGEPLEESTYVVHNLAYTGTKVGDFVAIEIAAPEAGDYDAEATFYSNSQAAAVQVKLDDTVAVERLDLFSPAMFGAVRQRLGNVRSEPGKPKVLRVEIVGRNEGASGWNVGLAEICLSRAATAAPAPNHNGFVLQFPPDLNAALRDDPVAGRNLIPSKYCNNVVHELRLARAQRLDPGARTVFPTLFHAWKGAVAPAYSQRPVGDGAVLIESPAGLALAVAGSGKAFTVGTLCADAGFLYLTPERLFVLDARSVTCAGQTLLPPADGKARAFESVITVTLGRLVNTELRRLWESAPAGERQREPLPEAPAWNTAAPLQVRQLAPIEGGLCLAAVRPAGQAPFLAVGCRDGRVTAVDLAGKTLGTFQAEGEVHALAACDLDGDGSDELIVGTDSGAVSLLKADLRQVWQTKIPYRPKGWFWYTLQGPKVRALLPADLNGDGAAEIAVGLGDASLQLLGVKGELLWDRETQFGTPCALAALDVLREGKPQLLAGVGILSGTSECYLFAADGTPRGQVRADGAGTGFRTLRVADLDADGTPTLFCGTSGGVLRTFAAAGVKGLRQMWLADLGSEVTGLAVVAAPDADADLIVAGSASASLVAFREDGEKVWCTPLSAAVSQVNALGADRGGLVAALCEDGRTYAVDGHGRIVAQADTGGAPVTLLAVAQPQPPRAVNALAVLTGKGLAVLEGEALALPPPAARSPLAAPLPIVPPAFVNLLSDGGFEADDPTKTNWQLWHEPPPVFDTTVVHSGKASLRASGVNQDSQWPAYQTVLAKPSTRYAVGAWVRTLGLDSKGVGILMAIQNTPMGADYARNTVVQFGPCPTFRLLLQEFVTGPDTVSLNVYGRLASVPPTATVWFDDVFLYEVPGGAPTLGAPLQVTAQPLPGEGMVSVTVDLTQLEHYYRNTALTCRIALTDRDSGRTVRRVTLAPVAAERQTLRLDVRGLEGGAYTLTAHLLAPGNAAIHQVEQALAF